MPATANDVTPTEPAEMRLRVQVTLLIAAAAAFSGCVTVFVDPGPPGISQETKDQLSFAIDQRVEIRHVRIDVVAGAQAARVWADIPIETGGVGGKRPVVLKITRDRDGLSMNDDFGPEYQAGLASSLAGNFTAIECSATQTCSETFTFHFERISGDGRTTLAFQWSVRARSEYSTLSPMASIPSGASLQVLVTK